MRLGGRCLVKESRGRVERPGNHGSPVQSTTKAFVMLIISELPNQLTEGEREEEQNDP